MTELSEERLIELTQAIQEHYVQGFLAGRGIVLNQGMMVTDRIRAALTQAIHQGADYAVALARRAKDKVQ